MEFSELFGLMKERQSIRSFRDVPLSDGQIQLIVDAAATAPSSLNSQPWIFVVLKDKAKKMRLREIYTEARKKLGLYEQDTSFVEKATPIVVVCEDSAYDKVLSCGMAMQNMFLAAESMGLGSLPSVTIQLDRESKKRLEDLIGLTPPRTIVLLAFFGHVDKRAERKPKKDAKGLVLVDGLPGDGQDRAPKAI